MRVGVFLKMPAPVRPASSQVPVLFLNPNYQDQYSSPLATPFPSTQSLQRDSPRCFTRNVQCLLPEDLSFALPHPSTPSDLAAMSHSIIPTELQLDKQELHNLIDKTSQWCMEGKDDIKEYTTVFWYCCQPLITLGHMSLEECKELYLQGFHPDVCARFPPDFKQEMWDILQNPLPQVAHSSEILPAPLSPAHTPPPPTPEMLTLSTDFVASTPALSTAPAPVPSPVSDLIAPPPSLSPPKGPCHALATPMPPTSAMPMICHLFSVLPLPPAHNISLLPPTPKHPTLVLPPPLLPVRKVLPPSSVLAVQPLST